METRENEIVARAVEIVADAILTAEATNGPLYEAIMAKVNDLRHRTPPSPQSGGAVELYRRIEEEDPQGLRMYLRNRYERATKAEAVIEAARKVCEDQAAIHDKSAWPQKYRAAFGAIAKLYDALDALDKE
jgi:hypothetical protein